MRHLVLLLSIFSLSGCLESTQQGVDDFASESPAVPGSGAPAQKSQSVVTEVTVQAGNRLFVESVLRNVFLSPIASPATVLSFRTILDDTVQRFPAEFGGALSIYSTRGLREFTGASCGGGSCSNSDMVNIANMVNVTPARASQMVVACQKLLDFPSPTPTADDFLVTAVANVGGAYSVSPTDSQLSKIPELFSPGISTNAALNTATSSVRDALKAKGLSPLEQWRGVFMAHCQSSYWHLL